MSAAPDEARRAAKRALKARGEEAARRELAVVPSYLWDGRTLPVPVERIADSHYGLWVEEGHDLARLVGLDDGSHLSGILLAGERRIVVDAREAGESPGRRRFTITHEIGHWVLHRPTQATPVFCRHVSVREATPDGAGADPADGASAVQADGAGVEAGADPAGAGEAAAGTAARAGSTRLDHPPTEIEANQFAAAMLMPLDLIAAVDRPRDQDETDALAQRFGVSRAALGRRFATLDEGG